MPKKIYTNILVAFVTNMRYALGMDFFIPFPFPNFGNDPFTFHSRSRILGMGVFLPFPFPNFGNCFFPFPSRSGTSGLELSTPVPVPELPKVIPAHPCLGTNLDYY